MERIARIIEGAAIGVAEFVALVILPYVLLSQMGFALSYAELAVIATCFAGIGAARGAVHGTPLQPVLECLLSVAGLVFVVYAVSTLFPATYGALTVNIDLSPLVEVYALALVVPSMVMAFAEYALESSRKP